MGQLLVATEGLERETVEVSGLPVLEHGFIGRRALQHEVRHKLKDGQRLFVLQGLGGLGKTALASQLLCKLLAKDRRDQLILRVQDAADLVALRTQAETHGHQFEGWSDELRGLQERFPDPIEGFRQAVLALRRHRPQLVVYADNMEALQVGPDGTAETEPGALGTWKPGVERWWKAMEELAKSGVVLASTRYGWLGLRRDALVPLDRMSRADLWRMIETFETLRKLPWSVRETIASAADGRPRTIQVLEDLLRQADDPTRSLDEVWKEHVAPVLAQHGAELTADLLLTQLWRLLSQEACDHAVAAGVLGSPAPRSVLDVLGAATSELLRAGLLTRHREICVAGTSAEPKLDWEDRWAMHASVQQFVLDKGTADELRRARTRAAKQYEEFITRPGARWADRVEAIRLYLNNGDATSAWPLACESVVWLRRRGQYAAALGMLETFSKAGLAGDFHAEHVSLLAMTRNDMGINVTNMETDLQDSLAEATSPDVRSKVLSALAFMSFRRGNSSEAQRVIQNAAGLLNSDEPARAFLQPLLAQMQDRYEEAEQLWLELLHNSEWMTRARQRGMSTSAMRHLGSVRVILGKYTDAEPVLRDALAVDESELGRDHPGLCSTLSDLALAVARQGRVQEGCTLLERALAIGRANLGETHPHVLDMQDRLRQIQGRP